MRFILIILFLTYSQIGRAEFLIGTGYSSITEGRVIPMLNLGLDSSSSAFLLSSVGVHNDIYFHNAYMLSAYRQTDLDKFWWGNVRAGLGGGIHYSKRGYKDGGKEEKADDLSIGPAVRATWEIFPYGYVGIEAYFGIGGIELFVLSTQQVTHLVFGVRF